MLFLLSPAMTLDYETPVPLPLRRKASDPQFVDDAAGLITLLREQTPAQLASLMGLSDRLAQLNAARYAAWSRQATAGNSKPAVLAFDGDVYQGLDAGTLDSADLRWAQQHLVILSGLYGVLRPLDRLQPYRLEMGTTLANPRGRDLYAYWGDRLAEYLNQRLQGSRTPRVVNLASVEYARAALRPALRAQVVDCVFEEVRPDGPKLISFFAKKARGLMARYAVRERVRSLGQLEAFGAEGYALDRAASTNSRLVFRRRHEPEAVAKAS